MLAFNLACIMFTHRNVSVHVVAKHRAKSKSQHSPTKSIALYTVNSTLRN